MICCGPSKRWINAGCNPHPAFIPEKERQKIFLSRGVKNDRGFCRFVQGDGGFSGSFVTAIFADFLQGVYKVKTACVKTCGKSACHIQGSCVG